MATVFIFAEQINSLVRSGKKELILLEGARISPAAADLIKEHQIKVTVVLPEETIEHEPSVDADKSIDSSPVKEPVKPVESPKDQIRKRLPDDTTNTLTKEQLEVIVDRVLERFRQIKKDTAKKAASENTFNSTQSTTKSIDNDDLVICRCEEITREEIKAAIRNGIHTLNGIKRITRAGMGLCQGQTCQQLIAGILAEELKISMAEIDPTTARGPVRPLRLEAFANS